MSSPTMHRMPSLLGLVVILALGLTISEMPITAQQAPIDVQASPAETGDAFRSSSVMFIESSSAGNDLHESTTGFGSSAGRASHPMESKNVELVSQIGGLARAVAVQANYAYLGVGPRLVVVNIANPLAPVFVGQTNVLSGLVNDVAVAGNYAYVAVGSGGLRIVSVASPGTPREIGFFAPPMDAMAVAVAGNLAYIADFDHGLRVINVSNPAAPTEVGSYTRVDAYDVVVAADYAYVAASGDGLRIISVADPTTPREVGFYADPVGNSALRVAVAGGYAYVADYDIGLRVINVSNPAAPHKVGTYYYAESIDVSVIGVYVFLSYGSNGLRVVNVANPSAPRLMLYDSSIQAQAVAVAGGHAYIADPSQGLRVFEAANPAQPTETGVYHTHLDAIDVAVTGSYAYVTDASPSVDPWGEGGELQIFDITDRAIPRQVGSAAAGAGRVRVRGDFAYVVDWKFQVVSVTNPAMPRVVGSRYNYQGTDLAIAGDLAFVSDYSQGLRVVDIADPGAPHDVGTCRTPGLSNGVAVAGSYAYVADGGSGLRVINVANPAAPFEVGSYDTPDGAFGVAVAGSYAYVADGFSGLRIINVANPAAPFEVGSYDTPGWAYAVAVAGSYLYVVDANTLRVINVANPAVSFEVGSYDTPGDAHAVAVEGSFVYVAADSGGLLILRFTGAPTYTISGRVTDAGGFTGIGGVTVWAGATRSTTTDANGNYTFAGLPAGTYTIRPEKAPYAFSPPSRAISVPADQTGVDFRSVAITKIQVNQVLGNTTNYVAGKDTAVRVFLSGAVPFDPDHQQLQVYRNGNLITLTPLRPRSFTGRSDVLDFLCDRQECDGWQKGFYSFEARVNGDYLIQPSVEFKERARLRILEVPVKAKVNGQVKEPTERWKTAHEVISKWYPVASDAVSYTRAAVPLDATDLNLAWPLDVMRLWDRARRLQPSPCGSSAQPACYDLILAITPEDPAALLGNTIAPPAVIAMDGSRLPSRVAHEVGHLIGYSGIQPGLGDEYGGQCGAFRCDANPPPASYTGKNGRAGICELQFHCPEQVPPVQSWEPLMGSKVTAAVDMPYEVGGRGAAQNDKLSFMGGDGEQAVNYWVSPAAYDFLYAHLPASTAATTQALQAVERVAAASGWIAADGSGSLGPIYHSMGPPPSVEAGPYTVEVRSAAGSLLSSQGFDVSFVLLTNPPQQVNEMPFQVQVRLPAESSTIRLMHGGDVLAETQVSAHPPSLALITPERGDIWPAEGSRTIRWQGSDLDGDTLHYTVLYRQGGGDWSVLGADLTTNELTVDAAGLPGGPAAQVQVLATDGINTTTVESGLFTVGRKGPEAFITYPAEGASFMPGASFFLQGTAYDLEDGRLPDSAYRWASNRDGDLGTGASNLVILSPGPHVITLRVTDSDGNTAVKTLQLSAGARQFLPLIWRSQ